MIAQRVRVYSWALGALSLGLSFASGCSRSPYLGSAHYGCGDGDRVIVAEHLFCVFTSAREARPVMSAGEEVVAGAEMPPSGGESMTPLCPEATPNLYVYDSLYICSAESEVSAELIESVVVRWGQEYFEAPVEAPGADQGARDMGIGLVGLDASVSSVETSPDNDQADP